MMLKHCLKRVSKYLPVNVIGLSAMLMFTTSYAEYVKVGAGGYTTDLPQGRLPPSDRLNQPAFPTTAPGFAKTIQTNDWWSSLIWHYNPESAWSENMYPHPFSFHAQANGLEVGYPSNYYVTPFVMHPDGHMIQDYHYPHVNDMLLGIVGLNAPNTTPSNYTDWTVTGYWSSGGKTMEAVMGSGLPYVYVTAKGGNTFIVTAGNPTIWKNENGVIGLTVNGRHYGIFAPHGSTWTISGNQLQSNLNGKDYYSVAILPDNTPATFEIFRKRAYAFVTDTKVEWAYDEDKAIVTTKFTATTVLKEPGPDNANINHPLMALYRHQWLHAKDELTKYTYVSPHGQMKVVDAGQFTVELPFTGMIPFLPAVAKDGVDTFSTNQLYGYVDQIYKQTPDQRWNGINAGTDSYWFGKAIGRIAHLIPIAEQVKHTAARDLFLAELKAWMEKWFKGDSGQLFYYDKNWKTIIGYPASYGSDIQLNDHHFHWGYFVMAASIIAHYDPAWAANEKWGGMVELLIRDTANWKRDDPQFPFLRNFDVYAGHGWATGSAAFTVGNNEESSSEDLNFSSALILWGTIKGNKQLRDLGIYLYATTAVTLPQQWFDVDNVVFPPEYVPPTVGMVWGDGGAYGIWWQGSAQEVHGINFYPIQPGMLYLNPYGDYLKINQKFMVEQGGGGNTQNVWRDMHWGVKVFYDPIGTIQEFNQNQNYTPEPGASKAHTYHWIHTLNQLGNLNTEVTADVPTYAVFDKNGQRNYVAYNADDTATVVTFSDGTTLNVPARSVAASNQTTPPPDGDHTFTEDSESAGEVIFTFKPNWETAYVKLKYTINNGTPNSADMVEQDGVWKYTISGLKDGDAIEYYYNYDDDGESVNSKVSEHSYKCSGGGGDDDDNPPSNNIDDTANYTLTGEATSPGAKITFVSKVNSTFVDIHYRLNSNDQLNYRMQNSGNTWTYAIPNAKSGDTITFFISYDNKDRRQEDTKMYTYKVP